MRIFKFIAVTILSFLVVSCSDAKHSALNPSDDDSSNKFEGPIDFAVVTEQIFDHESGQCVKCHETYRSYSVVARDIAKIMTRVRLPESDGLRMPSASQGLGKLSQGQIELLQEWVAGGLVERAPNMDDTDPPEPTPVPVSVGFASIKHFVLEDRCNRCHTHYDDLANVKAAIVKIGAMALGDEPSMPLNNRRNIVEPLTEFEKSLLRTWILAGAPEEDLGPPSETELPPLEPTWASLQANVFGPKCVHCHNGARARAGLNISTKAAFDEQADYLFDAENPSESVLIRAIVKNPDDEFYPEPMPPEFSRSVPVTPEELEVIKEWMRRGGP